jgi:hypothetical protein
MQSDIRIVEVETFKVVTRCRTPLKFGAVVVDELPIGYARVGVENRAGQRTQGWGAMFLMDLWAWPVSTASHAAKNQVMCELFDASGRLLADGLGYAHPIEIFKASEAELARLNREICARLTPGKVMPYLGGLICASPLDHAIHDAFGHANGIDAYHGYGSAFMGFDLSRYLGDDFRGVYPSQFLR